MASIAAIAQSDNWEFPPKPLSASYPSFGKSIGILMASRCIMHRVRTAGTSMSLCRSALLKVISSSFFVLQGTPVTHSLLPKDLDFPMKLQPQNIQMKRRPRFVTRRA